MCPKSRRYNKKNFHDDIGANTCYNNRNQSTNTIANAGATTAYTKGNNAQSDAQSDAKPHA